MRKVPLDIPSDPNPNDTNEPITQSVASDIAKRGPSTPQVLDNVIHDEMVNATLFGVIRDEWMIWECWVGQQGDNDMD